jgi:hypothetical protein
MILMTRRAPETNGPQGALKGASKRQPPFFFGSWIAQAIRFDRRGIFLTVKQKEQVSMTRAPFFRCAPRPFFIGV